MRALISICIPLYNGSIFLSQTLDSLVGQNKFNEIELVLCDDVSKDDTFKIAKKYADKFHNISLYMNENNLGMDRNFEQVVSHASGEYFWFCGQDDIFSEGTVEKVLSILNTDRSIDFIYVNYSQNNHDLDKVITEKMLPIDHDILCADSITFLSITGIDKLPTFLPSFVLRKILWDKVDKEPFYGTQYIQIGVLLTLLPNIKSYFIAAPYIRGRIPDNGWQRSTLKLFDIFTGFLAVIIYIHKNQPSLIPDKMYRINYRYFMKMIRDCFIKLRIEKIDLNKKLNNRIRVFNFKDILIMRLLLKMPCSILIELYNMFIAVRSTIRKLKTEIY